MLGPLQVATSLSTDVVASDTSERAPPITPAIEVGPVGVLDHDHLGVERAGLLVERLELLAGARAAHVQARRRRRARSRRRASAGR